MDILYILQLIIKLFSVLKLFIRPPICFGSSYAIIRWFVFENRVLLCFSSFVFSLSVVVYSVLLFLLPSWLVIMRFCMCVLLSFCVNGLYY